MTHPTKIQWATDSANVYRYERGGWHCVKVSQGCRNCYAEKMNLRFGSTHGNGFPYSAQSRSHLGAVSLAEDVLTGWKKARRPRRIFLNSMTDTFLEGIPEEMLFRIFDAMVEAPSQLFYVLTKRAQRMAEAVNDWLDFSGLRSVPHNIMCGVSIESQKVMADRLYWLSLIPGLRFLSVEPLLGNVELPRDFLKMLHWIIVGGESGVAARPMHKLWVDGIRKEAEAEAVPFFLKQWGAWWPLKELVHHGMPDNALAYKSYGLLAPDGSFQDRKFMSKLYDLTSMVDYNGRLLMVKPIGIHKPEEATLDGVAYQQYAPSHAPLN